MKNVKLVFCAVMFLGFIGCAGLQEQVKVIWGSSTKALEAARAQAIKKTFSCSWEQCFDAVLAYANFESEQLLNADSNVAAMNKSGKLSDQKTVKVKNLEVFLQDRRRKVIVVMGVPGSVSTTEIGIFFTSLKADATSIEVTSLSTSAKVRTADILFAEIGSHFKEVN